MDERLEGLSSLEGLIIVRLPTYLCMNECIILASFTLQVERRLLCVFDYVNISHLRCNYKKKNVILARIVDNEGCL